MAKKKILIIDDEQSITRLLKAALEQTGSYEVSFENDSMRAMASIRSSGADLLILDVNMPQVDGAEIARSLADDPLLRNLPIIFLTGIVSDEEAERGIKIGGHPAMAKPINMGRLLEQIQATLR